MDKWWQRSDASTIEPRPWLSDRAVAQLELIIKPDMAIIEHGSGGSSLWFAERAKRVISIESDQEWFLAVKKVAPKNLRVTLGQFPLKSHLSQKFDLLLIDGEPVADRAKWLELARRIVKPKGVVVLDNANRPEYALQREALRRASIAVHTIDANEQGTKHLVTEFFYL